MLDDNEPAVVIFTSPDASIFRRSIAFKTACAFVGVQTPLVHTIFDVGLAEIVTAAWVDGGARSAHKEISKEKIAARPVEYKTLICNLTE
jgi:hypothetical protein